VILIKTGKSVNFTGNDDLFFVYFYCKKKVFLTKSTKYVGVVMAEWEVGKWGSGEVGKWGDGENK
jgi:hypothetical protein